MACKFCGGACGRVCQGLGFKKNTPDGSGTTRKVPSARLSGRASAPAPKKRRAGRAELSSPIVPPPRPAVPRPTAAPGGDHSPLPPVGLQMYADLAVAASAYIDALDAQDVTARRIALTQLRHLVGKPLRPDTKPWLAEGISERTYYRRRAKETAS